MNIVLTGFMGTGKTAVGRRVADALHCAFEDVDRLIERRSGRSVEAIFSSEGEAAFRKLEADTIVELVKRDHIVISTGGGALIDPVNHEQLTKNGLLICLTARVGTLLERLKNDGTRPLLAGENLESRLERLMKERESVYARCPVQIMTDGKTISEVTAEIIEKIKPSWKKPQ
jgi:shikimate kinase